ncbi:hypothetical protein PENSUB_2453 [Penicillium subrubescens]|uniref:Prion-inhibition and propagation HeLo domain-containing protein n=1 Tax=Penicillium subrubescens TaxID=1316194 RepID=A0A1Q5UHY1_9EURO|nr:hypothetical protein PENSUB_2453 [Penicillium subrubescens]
MPTGFEAVGLALAIFPILIEAIKFYTNEKDGVSDTRNYQRLLIRISRDLDREQTIFHNSCQRFMEDIAAHCGVGEEEPAILDKRARRRQWKKIILVLKKDLITEQLTKAEKLNTFLARLTEQNQPTATNRHTSCRSTKHYKRIRSHAIDLYNILKTQSPAHPTCKCALQPDHVNMRSEFRSAQSTEKGLYFHTIFVPETAFNSSSNWREIESEPWGTSGPDLCQDPAIYSAQVQVAVTPPTISHGSSAPTNEPEISNLCAFVTGPASKDWLGRIASPKGQQHRIRAMDHQKRLPAFDTIDKVSLGDVLGDDRFGEEQQLRLALKTSLVRDATPYNRLAHRLLEQSDISFLRSSYGVIDFDNPLVGRTFGNSSYTMTSMSPSLPRPMMHASIPCLFSLGIVLLELRYRTLFEDLKTDQEQTMIPEISDLATARRLAYDMVGSPNHQNAVLRCILGLDAAYRSLTEAKFQDEVEEKIVFLLAEDLKINCAKPSVEACLWKWFNASSRYMHS